MTRLAHTATWIGVVGLVACGGATRPTKPTAALDVAAAYRACQADYNARRWDQLRACYADDVIQDEPGTGKPWVGIDDVIDHLQHFVDSFPDNTTEPELTLINGTHIISIVRLRGTNDGPFPGAPGPTHQAIGFPIAHVVELDAGAKVKSEWILYDTLTMLGQLGILPVPARDRLTGPAPEPEVVVADGAAREQRDVVAFRAAVDAFNAHDLTRFGAGLADEMVWTDARQATDLGRADALAATAELWRGFSDLERTPATVWAAGAYVVATGQMTGTNDGPVPSLGLDHTGKTISATYVEIAHFTGGKRDRSWLFYNGIVVASQLGVL